MDTQYKNDVISYLNRQIHNADDVVQQHIFETGTKQRRTHRYAFDELNQYLQNYIDKRSEPRILVLYGLRGTGKTTLLAQLYDQLSSVDKHKKLFLSLDQAKKDLNAGIHEIVSGYEDILGVHLEKLDEPVFLFLDEVHFDEKWDTALKILFDKTKNVFVLATGSSAIALHKSADLARRSIHIRLTPVAFTEYIAMKGKGAIDKDLSEEIRKIIFYSHNAEQVFSGIKRIESRILQCNTLFSDKDMNAYIQYASLPFTLKIEDKSAMYSNVQEMIDRIIYKDIATVENFSPDIITEISRVLYLLSGSDIVNVDNLSKTVQNISRPTLISLLEALERADIIWRLYPYGAHHKQTRKPSKYLFVSSAFRSLYFNLIESTQHYDEYKGKLLEDVIGMMLRKQGQGLRGLSSINYDNSQGGADFIVQNADKKIVIEVGYGNKDIKQVIQTMQKPGLENSYGVVLSENPLQLHEQHNIVEIPLNYFLVG